MVRGTVTTDEGEERRRRAKSLRGSEPKPCRCPRPAIGGRSIGRRARRRPRHTSRQ
ncbi:hypothetical protein ACP4OV_026433 [Aristida adscensionis]